MTTATFTIGCDPEVFLTKNGKPASAYGLLKGTKKEPFLTEGGAYQVDGMAAEFNTTPVKFPDLSWLPDTFDEWNEKILLQLKAIREALPKGYSLKIDPVMEFGKEFLDKQPDEAKELGCDPDYCAYTLLPNPRPDGEKTFRTGAGHIHIGWGADIPVDNKEHIEICAGFVKSLDATVGLFMTYIDRDPRRRELYGKAGAFRPKPYGVEYRTPSNVWIRNKDYRRMVWILVKEAINLHKQQYSQQNICNLENVRDVINRGDHYLALRGLDYIFQRIHRRKYYAPYRRPAILRRIVDTVEKEYSNAK
jgi:hypothetical protein